MPYQKIALNPAFIRMTARRRLKELD